MGEVEKWKQINGFQRYEISNFGNGRSNDFTIKRIRNGKVVCVKKKGRVLKKQLNNKGYYYVYLSRDVGEKSKEYIHRLVAKHFVKNPFSKPCVNHIDNNPLNNIFTNLEWCTKKENTEWMIKQHRNVRTEKWLNNLRKSQEKFYKPIIAENIETGEKIFFEYLNSVKDKGFQPSCVCNCCKGNRNIKQHKGYVFRYATKEEIGDYRHEETN